MELKAKSISSTIDKKTSLSASEISTVYLALRNPDLRYRKVRMVGCTRARTEKLMTKYLLPKKYKGRSFLICHGMISA